MQGTIRAWISARGFGFVTPSHGGEDAFLHANEVDDGLEPAPGDIVEYDEEPDRKYPDKLRAVSARIIRRAA